MKESGKYDRLRGKGEKTEEMIKRTDVKGTKNNTKMLGANE